MQEKFMEKALELAKLGTGQTNPNPLVGAVIVKSGKIIGEGYHQFFGGLHAEVNAINNSQEDVSGADMYVSLEPCSHYGKTPPCVDAIIKHQIKNVYVCNLDPNPLVSGRGIKKLQDAGINVETGILEEQGKKLNQIFCKFITSQMPFCLIKSAMTLDGKIASYAHESKWITNQKSREYVHLLRHQYQAILVGIGTVLADNPSLTTRLQDKNGRDPIRIIVDEDARIPLDAKVLNINSESKTIIATTQKANKDKLETLKSKGAEVIITPTKDGFVDLQFLMAQLGKQNIDSVLIEGGSEINASALNSGIVDQVKIFIAPKIIGGANAITFVGGPGLLMSQAIKLDNIRVERFNEDIMISGDVRKEVD